MTLRASKTNKWNDQMLFSSKKYTHTHTHTHTLLVVPAGK